MIRNGVHAAMPMPMAMPAIFTIHQAWGAGEGGRMKGGLGGGEGRGEGGGLGVSGKVSVLYYSIDLLYGYAYGYGYAVSRFSLLGAGVTCSKRKRADPVSMSVTLSARLGACSKRQAC